MVTTGGVCFAEMATAPKRARDGRGSGMRVRVDTDKCQGHNRCYGLAPELFDVDDMGQAVVIGDGTVPEGLEHQARLAVANCPEYAITIDEEADV